METIIQEKIQDKKQNSIRQINIIPSFNIRDRNLLNIVFPLYNVVDFIKFST